jgi:hypothetical protein
VSDPKVIKSSKFNLTSTLWPVHVWIVWSGTAFNLFSVVQVHTTTHYTFYREQHWAPHLLRLVLYTQQHTTRFTENNHILRLVLCVMILMGNCSTLWFVYFQIYVHISMTINTLLEDEMPARWSYYTNFELHEMMMSHIYSVPYWNQASLRNWLYGRRIFVVEAWFERH